MSTGAGLRLERVEIFLGATRLLSIDAHIQPGRNLTIMGPSGTGKSALIAFISGFLPPAFSASGRVVLNGTDMTGIAPEQRHMGTLFQDALLFPHLSVSENLLFALPAGGNRAQRCDKVEALLDQVGLGDLAARDPGTLSGGQAARVALMRVLAAEPSVLLLDEPFSRLDIPRRDAVREFVFSTARNRGLPSLLVTHDTADAEAAGGEVIAV
ncbi:MAG: ATP-binding cassette domain-containing protein [Alphaproteobacteria bacterium]|nr:ATP-binding cassette domain-containing protein [Alphaproteobacteria bacterium]